VNICSFICIFYWHSHIGISLSIYVYFYFFLKFDFYEKFCWRKFFYKCQSFDKICWRNFLLGNNNFWSLILAPSGFPQDFLSLLYLIIFVEKSRTLISRQVSIQYFRNLETWKVHSEYQGPKGNKIPYDGN